MSLRSAARREAEPNALEHPMTTIVICEMSGVQWVI